MAYVTLHRASRVLDSIQKALKLYEPKVSTKLSIFSQNPREEVAQRERDFKRDFELTGKLLSIRARVRQAVADKNAECGISGLLAAQAAEGDALTLLERLPGVAPQVREPVEDEYGFPRRRNRKPAPPSLLDVEAVLSMVNAARDRYAAADANVVEEVEVCSVDAESSKHYRKHAVKIRRTLDEISENLRSLNSTNGVEILEEDMEWLKEHEVV